LNWNRQVGHIMATSSNTGYTVVWDLKNKREVMQLSWSGNNSGQFGQSFPGMRRSVTAVAWHPDEVCLLNQIYTS
jgi:protein transport protein SEC31